MAYLVLYCENYIHSTCTASLKNARSVISSLYICYTFVLRKLVPRGLNLSQSQFQRLKPIFHWKWGSRWLPNQMKSTKNGQRKKFAFGTQRNLYSTDSFLGVLRWVTQIVLLCNLTQIYQHVRGFALGDTKVLSFALGDAKVPNANGFASQWNIGLRFTENI